MDKEEQYTFEDEVEHILETLRELDPTSKEYRKTVQNLRVLCEARSRRPARLIEPETILTVLANLIGIGLIIRHEQFNVITTRATNLLIKPK